MITTINGDMREQDGAIADNSVGLLLTDPPYNISGQGANPIWKDKDTGENKSSIHNQKFDQEFEEKWDDVDHSEFLNQIDSWAKFWFKKMRGGGTFAIFISDRYISYLWKIMEDNGFEPKRVWTWKKPAAVPFNRAVNPVSGCEYLLFGIKPKGKRTFNASVNINKVDSLVERYAAADKASSILYKLIKDSKTTDDVNNIFDKAKQAYIDMLAGRKISNSSIDCVIPNTITYSGGSTKNRIHPTEKPVELLKYFIELLSNPGDLVLDTFAGSGSTGAACDELGRDAILIEKDPVMFAKMVVRLNSPPSPTKDDKEVNIAVPGLFEVI